jgi:chromosome partitioning protein
MAVVVGLVSQKGGTGKSTLARALGAVVAHAGLKVRVADLDPQRTVLEWEKTRDHNRVSPALEVQGFATVAQALAGSAEDELVILDAPARAGRRTVQIAEAADLIVQPSSGSIDELRPAVVFFHELVESGIPKDRLVVALCRTLTQAEEDAARLYIKKAGYAVLDGAIPERAAHREAHGRGEALTEVRRRADDPIDRLMEALFAKVHIQMQAKARHVKAARVRES